MSLTKTIYPVTVDDLSLARECFETGEYDPALAVIDSLVLEGRNVFKALLLKACIATERKRFRECLKILDQAGDLLDGEPAELKAKYYGQRAYTNKKLGNLDSPLVDYEAARYWAQEAGDELCEASVRNNLAKRYSELGRLNDALQESDAAIRIATDAGDVFLLGRFLDLKAQILLEHERLAEAVTVSRKAIEILEPIGNAVALDEAKSTYGKALIALGMSCLNGISDPLETSRLRKQMAEKLFVSVDENLIRLALDRTGGRVSQAAKLLGMAHVPMMRAVEKFGLERKPKRRRGKSLIGKD